MTTYAPMWRRARSIIVAPIALIAFAGCGRIAPGTVDRPPLPPSASAPPPAPPAPAKGTKKTASDPAEPASERPATVTPEERKKEFGFGVVPGFRAGRAFGSVAGVAAPVAGGPTQAFEDDDNGFMYEPHVDGLLIFPGDKYALGGSVGYVLQGYNGPTLTALFMMVIEPRLVFTGDFGVVFGGIVDPIRDEQAAKTGVRYGAGMMYIPVHLPKIDLGVRFEVFHTESGTETIPGGLGNAPGSLKYSGTTISLDATATFDALK